MKKLCFLLLLLPFCLASHAQSSVYLNGKLIADDQVKAYEASIGTKIEDGRYWYDKKTGMWGVEGGPMAGLMAPNLDIGGPLHPDASNGNTNIFVNGREIHQDELFFYQPIAYYLGGNRMWINGKGDVGLEGHPKKFNMQDFQNPNPSEQEMVETAIFTLELITEKNNAEKNWQKKVTNQLMLMEVLKNSRKKYPNNPTLINLHASCSGELSWYYLFTQQFKEAEQAARDGMKIDPTQEWINTNLALSLLFQDKWASAKPIYESFKGKAINDQTKWNEVFLQDIADLEKAGVQHPDTKKLKALLGSN